MSSLSNNIRPYADYFNMGFILQAKQIAKPPLQDSTRLTNQVLGYLQSNPQKLFPQFNGPQISAIGAALTRRLTMIQGPPGTG